MNTILAIFISPGKGMPMEKQQSVHVVAGRGIEGDRYESRTGAYFHTTRIPDEDRQISLISAQGIKEGNARLVKNDGQPFEFHETRRNLILDIDPDVLNSLVGKRFTIGTVEMEGVELCTPCERPSGLVKKPGFMEAYDNRGGLRARILHDGDLHVGETISF